MSARWRLWWRALWQRRDFERELDDELAFHRDMRRDELIAQGLSPHDAEREARLELGLVELHRDDCRRARGIAWVDTLVRDARYALRGLARNPGYSITALAVLGIAIAANAVLFALFNGYAMQAPPVDRVERWVTLRAVTPEQRLIDRWTAADADALRREPPPMFEDFYWLRDIRLRIEADVSRNTFGEAVSDNYFTLLGVGAARGRVFDTSTRSDDADGVVLSDLGWRRLVDADPNAVGRTVLLGGRTFTVLGVAPPGFTGTTLASAMFWIRQDDLQRLRPDEFDAGARVDVGGFLRPGATHAEASDAVTARVLALNADKPLDAQLDGARVERRRGYLRSADVEELATIGTPAAVAFAALLVVAAANLANLVLARFAARRRELAVRAAVGASRGRLLVQLLAECVLLAGFAAAAGFVLASLAIDPLHRAVFGLLDEFGMELRPIAVDLSVFAYALGLSFLAALTFGGVPALLVTAPWKRGFSAQPDVAAMARAGHGCLRGALMVAQLSASVVLLVLAALIAGNAREAERIALGYDATRIVALQLDAPSTRLRDLLQRLPAVEAVGAAARPPLMGKGDAADVRVGETSHVLRLRNVDAGWFDALGLPARSGRVFSRGDETGLPVVVVSRRTADTLWPGQSPIGRTIDVPVQDAVAQHGRFEVIGVVDDIVSGLFIDGTDASAIYFPRAIDDGALFSVLVRLRDSSPTVLDEIARTCTAALPQQDCEMLPLHTILRMQHTPFLMAANIAGALGWTALAISCLGLYGLTGYLVLQKRREIGVRLALGATSARIVSVVLRQSMRQVLLSLAIGIPLAVGVALFAASVLPSLHTLDPVAFLLVPLLLATLALLAAWVPARRIAHIPATDALRDE